MTAASRTMLRISVACLCLAALIAIVALLSGDFDETDGRVTLTTLAVAVYGLTGVAGVASRVRRELELVGLLTVVASVVAFVLALILTWSDELWDDEGLAKAWGIATVCAFSLAQASLILLRRRSTDSELVRGLVLGTVIVIVVVAAILIVAIGREFDDTEDAGYRVLGALAVLDLLGTLLIPILRRLQESGGAAKPSAGPTRPAAAGELFTVPAGELEARVRTAIEDGGQLVERGTLAGGGGFALLRSEGGELVALVERD